MEKVLSAVICPKCGGQVEMMSAQGAGCNTCETLFKIKNGVLFFNTPPNDVPYRSAGKTKADQWGAWRSSNFEHIRKVLAEYSPHSKILDLGAGNSPFKKYINKNTCPNLISTDFGLFEMIDVTADLNENIPFKSDYFDVVIISNVLEHLVEPQQILKECFRILKPGGVVIGQTPFLMGLHDEPYDFYRYTKYSLKRLLDIAQFTNVEVTELSTTTDALHLILHTHFGVYQKKYGNNVLLRLIRKGIFSALSLLRRVFGELLDTTNPKGYGWIGRKN